MKKLIVKIRLSVFFTLVFPWIFFSVGNAQWVNTGVEAGFNLTLGVSPINSDFIMAGGDIKGGLYRSFDAGENWEYAGQRMQSFLDFAFSPDDENIVFAGSSDGLFRSDDIGVTWERVGFKDTMIFSLRYNPFDPDILYVGTGKQTMDGSGYGIFKSTDGGRHFINTGLSPNLITRILVSESDTSKILASSGSGVYLSSNSGGNWTPLGPAKEAWAGLPTSSIAWNGGDTIYASTIYQPGHYYMEGTVYRSVNAGNTWDSLKVFRSTIEDIEINPDNPNVIYAGIFESFNVKMGVWKSEDAGATWLYKSNGITDLMIKDIAIDPNNPSTLYATGDGGGGIYKSTDAGDNWNAANSGMTYFIGYQSKYFHAGGKDYIYAINSFGVYRKLPQIFRMDVSTENWQPCGNMLIDSVPYDYTMFSIRDMAQDSNNDSLMYAVGVAHSGGIFNHPTEGLFYKSDNGGLTWQLPYSFGFRQVHTVAVTCNGAQQVILAGTGGDIDSLYGVWKSLDGGQSFSLTSGWFPNVQVFDLQVDPFNPSKIVAATAIGIMLSSDYGNSWSVSSSWNQDSLKITYRVLIDSTVQGRIFSANGGWLVNTDTTNYGGVSWSDDNWNTCKYGGLTHFSGMGLTMSGDKIFVGTGGEYKISGSDKITGHGVLYAALGQAELNWIPLDTTGLEPKFILSLTSFDSIIYAGTLGGGVWKYDLRQLATHTQGHRYTKSNLRAWPNPFNSTVTIRLSEDASIQENMETTICIFDFQGKQIAQFEKTAGEITNGFLWSAKGLQTGIYSIKIVTGGKCFSEKLVLINKE